MGTPEQIVDLNRIGMALADTRTEILSMLTAARSLITERSAAASVQEFLHSMENVTDALNSMGLALDQAQGNLQLRLRAHRE
jgi:hypothetical protein